MLKVTENRSSFKDSELVQMVRRENNPKRNWLLVDSLQGKHVPADPEKVLNLYSQLAQEVKKHIGSGKTVFIGFAETATAVGAGVASAFDGSYYIHTTREVAADRSPVAEFKEEHSHAVEQLLYCDSWSETVRDAENIVFCEDEISTGKTIMNFIKVLKNSVPDNISFSACSILNGMSAEREEELKKEGVSFYWLLKHHAEPESDEVYTFEPDVSKRTTAYSFDEYRINGMVNPRTGSVTSEYISACEKLAETVCSMADVRGFDIAVTGSEEFMYPAILTALRLKQSGASGVVTHSGTRSPIIAENTENYPLKSRFPVESFYEKKRKTYIYNSDIKKYDLVIVMTDSGKEDYDFSSMADAFGPSERFILIRWVQ